MNPREDNIEIMPLLSETVSTNLLSNVVRVPDLANEIGKHLSLSDRANLARVSKEMREVAYKTVVTADVAVPEHSKAIYKVLAKNELAKNRNTTYGNIVKAVQPYTLNELNRLKKERDLYLGAAKTTCVVNVVASVGTFTGTCLSAAAPGQSVFPAVALSCGVASGVAVLLGACSAAFFCKAGSKSVRRVEIVAARNNPTQYEAPVARSMQK